MFGLDVLQCEVRNQNGFALASFQCSGDGPIHAQVPIEAHPQFYNFS